MEHSAPNEVTGTDPAGPDPQLAVTMGFTGFGKKARTFDLEAMFEQTRRTAVERSRKTLEAREKEEEMNREKELRKQLEDVEPTPTPSSSRAGRDHPKPSSRDTSSSDSEDSSDSSDDELIGPPLPPKTVGEPVNTVDEDILGPLPPPLCEEGEEDDDDELEDEGEEENPVQRIPDSHEITLKHGTKTVPVWSLEDMTMM